MSSDEDSRARGQAAARAARARWKADHQEFDWDRAVDGLYLILGEIYGRRPAPGRSH